MLRIAFPRRLTTPFTAPHAWTCAFFHRQRSVPDPSGPSPQICNSRELTIETGLGIVSGRPVTCVHDGPALPLSDRLRQRKGRMIVSDLCRLMTRFVLSSSGAFNFAHGADRSGSTNRRSFNETELLRDLFIPRPLPSHPAYSSAIGGTSRNIQRRTRGCWVR